MIQQENILTHWEYEGLFTVIKGNCKKPTDTILEDEMIKLLSLTLEKQMSVNVSYKYCIGGSGWRQEN